ncbi:MAG: flagellar assembly protein FliW [Ignavibacteria bacterium]|jgi:flagellar assembly factor FliW|nr:flagellar assembly protein FliW [Ignavibacteria bacterium]
MANRITTPVTINSSQFGEVELQPDNIFYFENGMLGFENLNNFVLISDDDIVPFKWLMSVEEPDIMFPLISPWLVLPDYDPGKGIDIDKQVLFAVVTFNDGKGHITCNLKAPVILSSLELLGEQRILSFERYHVDHIINKLA